MWKIVQETYCSFVHSTEYTECLLCAKPAAGCWVTAMTGHLRNCMVHCTVKLGALPAPSPLLLPTPSVFVKLENCVLCWQAAWEESAGNDA